MKAEKKKKVLDFAHDYFKLSLFQFDTVRGVSNFKLLKVGDIVDLSVRGAPFSEAVIKDLRVKKISDLSHNFMKSDAEFENFEIRNHQEFLGLLNSQRPFNKLKSIDDEICVISLERLNYWNT